MKILLFLLLLLLVACSYSQSASYVFKFRSREIDGIVEFPVHNWKLTRRLNWDLQSFFGTDQIVPTTPFVGVSTGLAANVTPRLSFHLELAGIAKHRGPASTGLVVGAAWSL